MKKLILGLILTTLTSTFVPAAMADLDEARKDSFVSCYGDHHGSYLDFKTLVNSAGALELAIYVSNDSDEGFVVYKVSRFDKDSVAVPASQLKASLLETIADMNDNGADYKGFVMMEASSAEGSQMYLNLNKFNDQSFLVIDGYVEPLTCRTELTDEATRN